MQSIYPVLKYDDGYAAMEFLERAFGFERVQVNEGESGGILHAEMRFGDQVVMFGTSGEGDPVFNQGIGRTVLYAVVDDPDALHARAKEAGADVVMPLTDQEYGSREFAVRDPEGNIWSFGTYRPEPPG